MLGARVNNYTVVALIGEGGMGAVYLAQHTVIDRKAAIKVMRRELAGDPLLVDRFINEARATNAIRHPNIIDILDVGTLSDGVPFLIMEWLQGETLAARIERCGRIDIDEAVEIARQTALAIGAANAKGILHRDLKPENLLLVPDAATGQDKVKVLDFGIAKLLDGGIGAGVRTHSGRVMGTPLYMSPEQFRGLRDGIDQRSDVYSLGVVLYQMVCGRPPFVSEGTGDLFMMHQTLPPHPPRLHNPAISPHLEEVILKALAKHRDDRFASMEDLAEALVSGPLPPPPRPTRRAWVVIATTAAVASAVALLLAAGARRAHQDPIEAAPPASRPPALPDTASLPAQSAPAPMPAAHAPRAKSPSRSTALHRSRPAPPPETVTPQAEPRKPARKW